VALVPIRNAPHSVYGRHALSRYLRAKIMIRSAGGWRPRRDDQRALNAPAPRYGGAGAGNSIRAPHAKEEKISGASSSRASSRVFPSWARGRHPPPHDRHTPIAARRCPRASGPSPSDGGPNRCLGPARRAHAHARPQPFFVTCYFAKRVWPRI
jgi:hypothetical protein